MMRCSIVLGLGLLLASPAALALRCGSRVLADDARDFQVRERCGDPFWSETWRGVDVIGRDSPLERQREVQWSVWYYNFGPRALMLRLVFRDGDLQRGETLGYGVREIGDSCRANMNFTGLDSGELVARGGGPPPPPPPPPTTARCSGRVRASRTGASSAARNGPTISVIPSACACCTCSMAR